MVNWHEPTPFSRFLALILFTGVIPVLFFYLGMQYQQTQDTKSVMHTYAFPRLESYTPIEPSPAEPLASSTPLE